MARKDDATGATSAVTLTAVLAALADPARLATLRTLARSTESPCWKVQTDAGLAISRSTFSHHQRVLREAGLLTVTVRGPERLLTLRRDEVDAAFPGLLDAVLRDGAADAVVGRLAG